jgi:hypothetical protein
MPKTRFQAFLFTLMTVSFSVLAFVVYNRAIHAGGMRNSVFASIGDDLAFEFPVAFLAQFFAAGPLSRRLAWRVVDPRVDSPRIVVLAITFMTIPLMCPFMSLVSVMHHTGIDAELGARWLQAIPFNFPLAFFSQFLVIGPLVRFLFRSLYRIPSPAPGLSRPPLPTC